MCLRECGEFVPPIEFPKDSNVPWEKEFDKRFEWFNRKDSAQLKTIDCWDLDKDLKSFIRTLIASETAKERTKLRHRVDNVFAQKYEGVPRTSEIIERAVMNCLSDDYSDEAVSTNP